MSLRRIASGVRRHRILGPMVRLPFVMARRGGVVFPPRVYQHLWFDGPIQVQVPGNGAFSIYCYGDVIENSYYWAGLRGHEPECLEPWVELAKSARVVLDIGANTGAYSLICSAVNDAVSVHAFEPIERVAERTRRNVRLNPGYDIRVHQVAVGGVSGVAMLSDPGGENCYSASLDPQFLPGGTQYEVSVVSIDDFVRDEKLARVDLVKIDVEGFEEFVLEGMSRTIDECRPSLMIEYLAKQRGGLRDKVSALMNDGYALFHLTGEGPKRARSAGPSVDSKNVVLIPEERLAGLGGPFN